jgi:ankyrin repeat protein
MEAAKNADMDTLRLLLEHGGDINAKDEYKKSLVHLAA